MRKVRRKGEMKEKKRTQRSNRDGKEMNKRKDEAMEELNPE